MIALAIGFAALTAAPAATEQPDIWARVSPEFVRSLENRTVLPSGAATLERYDRFYSVEWQGEQPLIVGTFVERRPEQAPGRNYRLLGLQRVTTYGGGCSVLTLATDPAAVGAPSVACNEEARSARPAKQRRAVRPTAQIVDLRR
jgi:hypothetical protein